MHCKHSARGFTLIEVLVAFMILTLSLTILFRIFSGGLGNVTASGDYAHAVLIAESRLAAAGISEPLHQGVTYGDADEQFSWRQVVDHYVPRDTSGYLQGPLSAYRVTVEVIWQRNGREKKIMLSSVRLQKAAITDGAG